MFPLLCYIEELNTFIEGSRNFADGWIGFYWGHSLEDYRRQNQLNVTDVIIKGWLEYFQGKASEIIESKEK